MLNSVLKQLVLLNWIASEGLDKAKYMLLINGFKPKCDRLDRGPQPFPTGGRTDHLRGPCGLHTFLVKFSQ